MGSQLFVTNKDIVLELNSVELGGPLGNSTLLSNSSGIFHITNSVVVPAGGNLSIGPGCVLLFSPGANLLATNATVTVGGSEAAPVLFGPRDGGSVWGGLEVAGTTGVVFGQHMELTGGHVELLNGAQGTFEDSYFHDYALSSPSIIHTLGTPAHCSLTLKRCHVQRYHEILSQLSTNIFEDCLMEYQEEGGDGIDFDAGQPGCVIRHCTVRHGLFTNVDALDMGEYGTTGEGSKGVLIDSCLVYDFVDKGVSMGVQVDVTVTNCLIHDVDSAIAVKDLSVAGIYNCTLVSNLFGFNCYNKANPAASTGGGFITNSFNNILWGNAQTVALANGSTLSATFSDFQGTNFPGIGNVSVEPLWINPAGDDYRLSTNSPLAEAGKNGGPMGATFPVGAAMASSHPVLDTIELSSTNAVLRFWADWKRRIRCWLPIRCPAMVGRKWPMCSRRRCRTRCRLLTG